MPFTVVWLPSALNRLAEIWTTSADRQAVADAANRIENALRVRPLHVGNQKQKHRVYADAPLVVAFEVLPDDCMVRVVKVGRR